MSVSEVVLYYSTTSPACVPCIHFLQKHRLPVELVRLDTSQARARVSNGKNFSIKTVPTMMVVYQDGNMQLFVGQPKVLSWLNQVVQPPPPPPVEESPKPKKKRRKPKSGGLYGDGQPAEEEELIFLDEDEPSGPPPSSRPPPPPTGGLMTGSQARGKDSRSTDIMSIAKQMEKDAKASMWYNENDLPKSS